MSGMDTGGIKRVIDRRHAEWFAERDRDRAARTLVPDPDPRGRLPRSRVLVAAAAGWLASVWRRPRRETTTGT
jgi:hypothetical protein